VTSAEGASRAAPRLDLSGLDALLERLDPGRDAHASGLRPPAREAELAGLPPDLQALWRWHDGQERAAAMAREPGADGEHALVLVRRFGVTRRLRPQGRLLSVAEARALARPGFVPLFELPTARDEAPAWVGRRDDGELVHSFGPRAEAGRGGLAAWVRGLGAARRALYMIDLDHDVRAQRWVMAVPALMGVAWGAATDTFGMVLTPERGADVLGVLQRVWGVTSPETARERIAALRLDAGAAPFARARESALAGWCHRAGFLSLDEAWGHAVDAARDVRRAYRSWEELGRAEVEGRAADEPLDLAARDALAWLATAPCSPWRLLAWDTPLPHALPAPDEPEVPDVHAVTSSEELHAALFEAAPRSIVRLAPGIYRGAFAPRSEGLTIEAMPSAEVVLEGVDERPVVRVAHGGARLAGVVIAPVGEGVRLDGAHLHLDGCALEGGRGDAIAVRGRAGEGEPVLCVERSSVVEPGGSALVVTGGVVIARDVIIEAPGSFGVITRRAASALSRVEIRRSGHDGVRLEGGEHALDAVSVEGAGRSGLSAHARAVVTATSCVVTGAEVAAIELATSGPSTLAHCRLDGGRGHGVWLRPGHGARVVGGVIGGSRRSVIEVEGGRDIVLTDVDLGPSLEGAGVSVSQGGHVIVLDTIVRGTAAAGIEAHASRVEARGLSLVDVGPGVAARSGARVAARDLTCRRARAAAVMAESEAHAAIELLVIDEPVVGACALAIHDRAVGLVGTLVAPQGGDRVHVDDDARLAIARGGPGPAEGVDGGAEVDEPIDGAALEVPLSTSAFEAWGVEPSAELLARGIAALALALELEGVTVTALTTSVRVSGPPAALGRLGPRARLAAASPEALGPTLARLVFEDPEDDVGEDVVDQPP